MAATDTRVAPATAHGPSLREIASGLIGSLRWAMEVNRRCNAHAARHSLDGDAIRQIVAAVERERG